MPIDESRQRADWRNLRQAITAVRAAYPSAAQVSVTRSQENLYGFDLDGLLEADDEPMVLSDQEYYALAAVLEGLIKDLAWNDSVGEDPRGYAVINLAIWRPTQRFRIIRGPAADHKVVYDDDQVTRDARADHFADLDGERVLCETWTQETMLTADDLNRGWGCDSYKDSTDPSTPPADERPDETSGL